MKEFKRRFSCDVCNTTGECTDKNLYQLFKEAWEDTHRECEDMKYIFQVKISFKGGDTTTWNS